MTLPCLHRVLPGMGLGLCGVPVEFLCVVCAQRKFEPCVSSTVRLRTAEFSVCPGPGLTLLGSALHITHGYTFPCFVSMCEGKTIVCFGLFYRFIALPIVLALRPLNSVCCVASSVGTVLWILVCDFLCVSVFSTWSLCQAWHSCSVTVSVCCHS